MSLTVCCIVAHALRGSLSCCAHSAGAPILKLNTAMSAVRYFVLNFKNSLFILAFNETNAPIPQQFNGVGKPSALGASSEDARAWKKSASPQKKLRRFRFRSPFRSSFSRGACEHDKPSSRPLSVRFPAVLQHRRANDLPARSKSTDF
jgi:hypothetical protein